MAEADVNGEGQPAAAKPPEACDAANAAAHALSNLNRHTAASPQGDPVTEPDATTGSGYPFPPNYRIPNSKPTRTGRWTHEEHKVFLKGETPIAPSFSACHHPSRLPTHNARSWPGTPPPLTLLL